MTRKILITGASGGLGEALIKQLATTDTELFLVARNEEKLKALSNTYQSQYQAIHYCVADLSRSSNYEKVLQFANEAMDIVIHNAGYGIFANAETFTSETIEDMFRVNVLAPISLTAAMLSNFYAQKSGHIVFIASQASKLVTPKSSVYSATKFALRGYANGIRIEAKKHGVHVMTVNPGPIDTNFFTIADQSGEYTKAVSSMMLQVDDVAKAICKGIEKKKREVNLPTWMEIGARFVGLCPTLGDLFISKFGDKK